VVFLTKLDDSANLGPTVMILNTVWAMKKFVESVLEGDSFAIEGDTLVSSSGIVVDYRGVSETSLEEIMEHDYSLREMAWQLPFPYSHYAYWFRHVRTEPTQEEMEEAIDRAMPTRRRAMHRAPRDGMVPVADIATGLGLTAREARGLLRRAKIPKPPQGWAWPVDEAENIKAKLAQLKGRR